MGDNSRSSHKIESVAESTKRQKINHVKKIIENNYNEYINNPNLKTPEAIHDFANYLVSKATFFVATRPVELKSKIDFYLPGYIPKGGRRKSRKNRRKSRKHHRKYKRHSRR